MAAPHIINESIILEEVMATHDPDSKDFKTSFIFNFVKKILYPTMTAGKPIHEDEESDEEDCSDDESDKDNESDEEESNDEEPKDMELPKQIKQLSYEMSLKCQNGVNPHSTVIYFLKMLCTYSWEAKLLMVLAAFSLNFGEFSLVHSHKGFAGKLAVLKGSESQVVPMVTHFMGSVLHLTECIVELAQSSSHNSSPIIPFPCYWIITVVLTYASYFTCLKRVQSGWFIAKETQLSSLTVKINEIISDCRPILEKKREEDCCKALWHAFFDKNPISSTNLDVFKLVLNVKKGGKKKPIYDGESRTMVGLRSLKNNNLLLLVSSCLDIDNDLMMEVLEYIERVVGLRVLWIPILDCHALWAIKHMEKQYRSLVNKGNLLAVKNVQKSIAPGFVRFVKEKLFPTFRIGGEPIIISLDHQGRIVHHNAMHMLLMRAYDICKMMSGGVKIGDSIPLLHKMLKKRVSAVRDLVGDIDKEIEETAGKMDGIMTEWLRGIKKKIQNPVYSNIFTSEKEIDLWKIDTWCTKLLIGPIYPESYWVDENKYIFLIGGNDLKWVKAFLSKVMSVKKLTIMMSYVGSNVKIGSLIHRDDICEAPHRPFVSWMIWARLRSIFLSRIMFLYETHCDEDRDEIVAGLKQLLAYEAKDLAVDGWAMLCKGNKIVVCDLGDKMLTVMNEYEKWKESATSINFDQAFKDHYEMLYSTNTSQSHPYFALEYPSNFDKVPENLKCPQYCHNMQKFVTFRCNHGKVDDEDFD